MNHFDIEGLDHVAILVQDFETTINWYQSVLGLKKYQLEKWGPYPIFLLAGKSGLALFPAGPDLNKKDIVGQKIDHFAFNVTNENFIKARAKYEEMGLKYSFKDHHYFHSIYTKDPDGHTVELTTLIGSEQDFY